LFQRFVSHVRGAEIKQSRLKQTWNKFCFISVLFHM